MPDFSTISKNDAASTVPGLQVNVRTQYSTRVAFGGLISQSIRSGTVLFADDAVVQVVYSIGRPFIDDIIGKAERDLAEYFYGFSARGANITYNVTRVDSSERRGTVVWASKNAEPLRMTDHIEIHVSRGNLTPSTPDIEL